MARSRQAARSLPDAARFDGGGMRSEGGYGADHGREQVCRVPWGRVAGGFTKERRAARWNWPLS